MDQLVTNFLGLSLVARNDLERVDVDVSAVARAVVSNLRTVHPERTVEVVVDQGIHMNADPGLTRVVLENLVGNAWKFTSRSADAKIHVGATEREGRRVVLVRDNGAGFDATMADRLFEPFRRLHSQKDFEGTGVGLATVQRIVRRHGGQVWAESEPDRGATFFFTLSPPAIGS
jgi:light-regulated signal transduction histidine kinase (bacteriophytochrome)